MTRPFIFVKHMWATHRVAPTADRISIVLAWLFSPSPFMGVGGRGVGACQKNVVVCPEASGLATYHAPLRSTTRGIVSIKISMSIDSDQLSM